MFLVQTTIISLLKVFIVSHTFSTGHIQNSNVLSFTIIDLNLIIHVDAQNKVSAISYTVVMKYAKSEYE